MSSNHEKDIYITDPPLEKQVQSIKQLFNNITTIINDNIQSSDENDENEGDDGFLSQNKKQSSKNKDITVNSIGEELKGSIHKLFVDTVKSLRHAQKHDQGDNAQYIKSYLLDQFKDVRSNLQRLRNEMNNLLQYTIEIKRAKLSDSIIFEIESLMEEIMNQYCEDLYDIYLKMLQYSDSDFSTSIFNNLFNGIYDFSEDLEKYHLILIHLVDSIVRPVDSTANFIERCPDFNEEIFQKQSEEKIYAAKEAKLTEFYNKQLDAVIVDFKEAVTSINSFHNHIHEFSLNFFEQLARADPKFSLFDLLRVYEPRFTGFSNICNFYGLIAPDSLKNIDESEDDGKMDDYENDSDGGNSVKSKRTQINPDLEGIWEKTRHILCVNFANSEIALTGNSLYNDLFSAWRLVKIPSQSLSVGSLLYKVLNARFEYHDSSLRLTDVSSVLGATLKSTIKNNENYGDEEEDDDENALDLVSDLQSLLEGVIDRAVSSLLALRNKQIRFLSSAPLPGETVKYAKTAKQISSDIQQMALDLNMALSNGREADFALSQRLSSEAADEKRIALIRAAIRGAINDNEEEEDEEEDIFLTEGSDAQLRHRKSSHLDNIFVEEEEEDDLPVYADNFQSYENEESEEIVKQLGKIVSLSNIVFQRSKEKTNADFNNRKRLTQTEKSSTGNQDSSFLITKSMKLSIQRTMDSESIIHSKCIEKAMVSTYTQLLASIKGTLVALIRTSNDKEALKVKDELKERIFELLSHLDSIKKRAKLRDDVRTIKETDMQISDLKGACDHSIKGCICESLRNVIDIKISNYDKKIRLIDDILYDLYSKMGIKLARRTKKIMDQKHIPDLILIEKKKKIEIKKEIERMDFNSYEKEENKIGSHIESKEYALARIEKRSLNKKKKEAKDQRLHDLNQKYENLKIQKLMEQKKELLRMEERFNRKKSNEKRKADKLKEVQTRVLVTSIKSSSLRHYQLALKIIRVDQKSKREMQKMLNRVVNESIENKNTVKGVAKLAGEKGNKTDWVQ